jgi:hypothetical protein
VQGVASTAARSNKAVPAPLSAPIELLGTFHLIGWFGQYLMQRSNPRLLSREQVLLVYLFKAAIACGSLLLGGSICMLCNWHLSSLVDIPMEANLEVDGRRKQFKALMASISQQPTCGFWPALKPGLPDDP